MIFWIDLNFWSRTAAAAKSLQSCPTLCDPIDSSPPCSPIPGILQARHCLLQCMKVKSESEVAQSCLTLSNPMDCSLSGYSFHGIFQARVLEWFAIAFSWSRTTSNQILFLWLFLYALNEKVSLWYINHILHSKEINTILVKKKMRKQLQLKRDHNGQIKWEQSKRCNITLWSKYWTKHYINRRKTSFIYVLAFY